MGKLQIPVEVTQAAEQKFVEVIKAATGDLRNVQGVIAQYGNDSHHNTARDNYNGQSKHADKKPIGQEIYDKGNQVLDFIKKVDPSNSSGAVQPAVDIMKKLLNNTDPLQALQGMIGGDLYGIMNQVMGLINKAGGGGGGQNGGVQPLTPCSLVDPKTQLPAMGTLQYNHNHVLTCIQNKPDGSPGVAT